MDDLNAKLHCTICGSKVIASKINTGMCLVTTCANCSHQFTIKEDIYVKEIYDEAYFEDTHKNWFDNPQIKLFNKICKLIEKYTSNKKQKNLRLLDFGCGKGALLKHLANYFPSINLNGIDICEPAKDLDPRINIEKKSITDYNQVGIFDVIVSTAVIEHFDQPKVFIDRIKKALKSKGLMVIVTIDSNTPLYVIAKLMRLFGFSLAYKRLYDPHHLNHFSKKNLLRLAKNTDLEVCFSSGINVPLKSLDIPSSNILEDIFYKFGVLFLFTIGSIFGNPYLQIHVFKKKS